MRLSGTVAAYFAIAACHDFLELDFTIIRAPSKSPISSSEIKHTSAKRSVYRGAVELPFSDSRSYYHAEILFGSAKKPITLMIDTGSSSTWVAASNVQCFDSPKIEENNRVKIRDDFDMAPPGEALSRDFSGIPSKNRKLTGQEASGSIAGRILKLLDASKCKSFGSFEPAKSTTFTRIQDVAPYSIQYKDTSFASGIWARDSISFGGVDIANVPFGVVQKTDNAIGILGLGAYIQAPGSNEYPVDFQGFPALLKRRGLIDRAVFSLHLDPSVAKGGSVLFGAVDHNKYVGVLQTVALSRLYEGQDGIPQLFSVFLDSVSVKISGNKRVDIPVRCSAILDSGTTLCGLPERVLSELAALLSGNWNHNLGLYETDRESVLKKHVIFCIGSIKISVAAPRLLIRYEGKEYLGIRPVEGDSVVLGEAFLRHAYVVFDTEKNEVSIAQAKIGGSKRIEVVTGEIPRAMKARVSPKSSFSEGVTRAEDCEIIEFSGFSGDAVQDSGNVDGADKSGSGALENPVNPSYITRPSESISDLFETSGNEASANGDGSDSGPNSTLDYPNQDGTSGSRVPGSGTGASNNPDTDKNIRLDEEEETSGQIDDPEIGIDSLWEEFQELINDALSEPAEHSRFKKQTGSLGDENYVKGENNMETGEDNQPVDEDSALPEMGLMEGPVPSVLEIEDHSNDLESTTMGANHTSAALAASTFTAISGDAKARSLSKGLNEERGTMVDYSNHSIVQTSARTNHSSITKSFPTGTATTSMSGFSVLHDSSTNCSLPSVRISSISSMGSTSHLEKGDAGYENRTFRGYGTNSQKPHNNTASFGSTVGTLVAEPVPNALSTSHPDFDQSNVNSGFKIASIFAERASKLPGKLSCFCVFSQSALGVDALRSPGSCCTDGVKENHPESAARCEYQTTPNSEAGVHELEQSRDKSRIFGIPISQPHQECSAAVASSFSESNDCSNCANSDTPMNLPIAINVEMFTDVETTTSVGELIVESGSSGRTISVFVGVIFLISWSRAF